MATLVSRQSPDLSGPSGSGGSELGDPQGPAAARPLVRLVALILAARAIAEADVLPRELVLGVLVLGAALLALGGRQAVWTIALSALVLIFDADVPTAATTSGRWHSGSSRDEGEVSPGHRDQNLFEIVPGTLAEGEAVAILSTARATNPARGPVAPPPSIRGRRSVLPDECVRLATRENFVSRQVEAARSGLAALRSRCIGRTWRIRDRETRGLVRSVVFGERDQLDPQVTALFTHTGTRHLLAVSGLHVGLLALLLIRPLARLVARLLVPRGGPRRERVELAVCVACLAALFLLTGGRAPVTRAALAALFLMLARHLPLPGRAGEAQRLSVPRRADGLSIWSAALILECFVAGAAPLSLSVQLSYAATLALIACTRPVERALASRMDIAPTGRTGRARPVWFVVPGRRLVQFFRLGLAGSIVSVLATLPFAWTHFGEFSPIGILATPLLLPLFAVFLVAAWVWILFPLGALETVLDQLAALLVSGLELFDRLPGTPEVLPPRPFALIFVASAATLVALTAGRARLPGGWNRDWTTGALRRLACIAFGICLLPWSAAPKELELVALDVGSGTAVVFRAPGEECWIFDAGSRDRPQVARSALLPLLAAWEVSEVRVVLSHLDLDHWTALPKMIERYDVGLWAGALSSTLREGLAPDVPRIDLASGSLPLPTNPRSALRLTLWRARDEEGNEGSRTLDVEDGESRYVLCGDAEEDGLAHFLDAQEDEAAPVRLLLLPHHGSEGPHLGALLDQLSPLEVWASAGLPIGFARELDRRRLLWRTTRRDGPLTLAESARQGFVKESGRPHDQAGF